jgi:general secretion pathway protein G
VLQILCRTRRNRISNSEQGFTLIELLIVIVVLGILAAIVVFALGGVTSSSAAASCSTTAQSVNVAVAAEQASSPGTAPLLANGTAAGDLVPTYLATMPSSAYYSLSLSGTNTQVTLASGDPGYTATLNAATPPVAQAETFNGSSAWVYPTGTTPASLVGKGVCAGA